MTDNDPKRMSGHNRLELLAAASLTTGLLAVAPKTFGGAIASEVNNRNIQIKVAISVFIMPDVMVPKAMLKHQTPLRRMPLLVRSQQD